MYHVDHSVADEVRKAAELGYEYLELSPRPDWFFWHRYPKADDDAVAEVRKACGETGVSVLCLVPVFNWSSPDEQERRAEGSHWRRMMEYAGGKLKHLHVADCFNHRANVGNRYIVNPPGVDARVHQHNEIGHGDLDWAEFFATLRERAFDGIATVCVFGWEEDADAIHRRMLEKLTSELGAP